MTTYTIGEHYYTASKFKNGLHTLDNSKFLTADEINSLEKLGVYQTASGLNNNPTEEEIEKDFPVNIAFYRLPTQPNRFVYLHSQYTGRANHTPDRFGNFFTHSIILKDSQASIPAYFLFNQFKFKKDFKIEEDEKFQPQLGEKEIQIDTDIIRAGGEAFNHFCSFLEMEGNLSLFSRVIDLITDGILTGKGNGITICAEKNRVREIILSVNFLLPQHIANKISFATYVNNPSRYAFQLTGIIPECEITSLDSRYYTLIDATKYFAYEAKHDYTKFLVQIIKEKSENSFEQWKNLNKSLLYEFAVTEPSTQLNSPILFFNFINNPLGKNIQDFKKLLSTNLPLEKEIELKRITAEKNPELYLDFVIEELKRKAGSNYLFREKKETFNTVYLEHLKGNKLFRQNCLPQIVDSFRGISDKNKSEASLFVLLIAECSDILDQKWLRETMQQADEYFSDEFMDMEAKLESVKKLNEKYTLQSFQEIIPNIMKVKSFDDIRKAAEKDDFVRNIRNYRDFLSKATDKEKLELLLLGFNHDAYFLKGNFKNFDNYIKVVKEYLPEQQPDFWYRFFDNNRNFNKDNNPKKHSLDYLKKKFVSLIFLNQNENHELYSKINLEDGYTIRWIEEDIRETTTREAVLQTFAEAFKNYTAIRNSSFWSFFGKK